MVALKHPGPTAGPDPPPPKQERRGGIETVPDPAAESDSAAEKQERRGGIETGLAAGGDRPGARKQERRGGIETRWREQEQVSMEGSRNAVVALKHERVSPWIEVCVVTKQERRGGIETLEWAPVRLGAPAEAGTPWWH